MSRPHLLPPEWRRFRDEETGVEITQWTHCGSMHHHFYFTNPPISPDGSHGYFISYRTGYPNLFSIDLQSGELRQMTDRVDLNPFSPVRAPLESRLFFAARNQVWHVDLDSGAEAVLCDFPAATLGNCSVSPDGGTLAIGVRRPGGCQLALVDTADGAVEIATEFTDVGHIQFCPGNPQLIEFSGTGTQRIWLYDRGTGKRRLAYAQTPAEWIVHETWLGASETIVFPCWPHALRAINADGSGLRTICEFNAWHICASPDGRRVACDTTQPNRGIHLIDAASGRRQLLCRDHASTRGTQWACRGPAPGAGIDVSIIRSAEPEKDVPPHPDDPASTYGPQWSHPHPAFSPDGRQLVFTSDRDGWSQVYAVPVP